MSKPHIRLWDKDFRLLYSSETDPRTVEEFMADHDEVNFSEDFEEQWRLRESGKLIKTADGVIRRYSDRDFLHFIPTVYNPALDPVVRAQKIIIGISDLAEKLTRDGDF